MENEKWVVIQLKKQTTLLSSDQVRRVEKELRCGIDSQLLDISNYNTGKKYKVLQPCSDFSPILTSGE